MNAVDTNVFVYWLDTEDPAKQQRAASFVRALLQAPSETVMLWQVAGETLSCLRRWQDSGKVSRDDVCRHMEDILVHPTEARAGHFRPPQYIDASTSSTSLFSGDWKCAFTAEIPGETGFQLGTRQNREDEPVSPLTAGLCLPRTLRSDDPKDQSPPTGHAEGVTEQSPGPAQRRPGQREPITNVLFPRAQGPPWARTNRRLRLSSFKLYGGC